MLETLLEVRGLLDQALTKLNSIKVDLKPELVSVTIKWGRSFHSTNTYEFATQAELDAFLKGAEEAEGWDGYEVMS